MSAALLPQILEETVEVRVAGERARIYREGGISYDEYVHGIGWILNDSPSLVIELVAEKIQDCLR